MNTKFIEFLKKQIGNKSLGQIEIQTGVPKSTISYVLRGLRDTPKPETLKKLSKALPCSFDDLMEAAGYIELKSNKQTGVKIPVLGVIPAGIPIEAIEDILDYEEISEDMASRGEYFALKVNGDSMSPIINSGDIVIIKQQDDAENGKICVVIINGFDATLKRIKKEQNGIWVLPENPYCDFKPTFFTNKEIIDTPVKIKGVAVEIRRTL